MWRDIKIPLDYYSRPKLENQFMRFVVMMMPDVFILMALRATMRECSVMTGSSWHLAIANAHDMDMKDLKAREDLWDQVKAQEEATWVQDLQVATGFQFFAVFIFGQVCVYALQMDISHFEERNKLLQLSIMGLHAFVLLGAALSVISVVIAMFSSVPEYAEILRPYQHKLDTKVQPVFAAFTILAMANMIFLGRLKPVAKQIPNTNKKFLATRMLLLISQIQHTVLGTFQNTPEKASPVVEFLAKHRLMHRDYYYLYENQIRLLHSSLLVVECFAMTVVNYYMWEPQHYHNEFREVQARYGRRGASGEAPEHRARVGPDLV